MLPTRFRNRSAHVFAIAGFGAAILLSPRVDAGTPEHPVTVKNTGHSTVRVRVFTAEEKSCATGHQLFLGAVVAGEGVSLSSPATCVCAEQTFADTDDAAWTVAERFCRVQVCAGKGRAKSCENGPDPFIRIDVDETPGN